MEGPPTGSNHTSPQSPPASPLKRSLISCECNGTLIADVLQDEEQPSANGRENCLADFTIENYHPNGQTNEGARPVCEPDVCHVTWRKATHYQSSSEPKSPQASPSVERRMIQNNATNQKQTAMSSEHHLMGRITIYTMEGCSACHRSKMLLTQQNLPFLDIDIGKHTACGQELFRLTSKYSVPQIFFNEVYTKIAFQISGIAQF